MKDLPTEKLDPKIKSIWRINDSIWITIGFLVCLSFLFFLSFLDEATWVGIAFLVVIAIYALFMVVFLVILPPIRYIRWRYELNDDFLDIARGMFWRKRIVIPFIRVQNTDTRQGPIMRMFGLSSVTVATAAGEHEIPGIRTQQAEELRDKAAELARIAREDV